VISNARFEAGDLASLDLDELNRLHHVIYLEATAVHAQMMDGQRPIIPVLGDRWRELDARHNAYAAEMAEVDDEINRREKEARRCPNAGPAS
jgi:hypothetical protein